ncbi:MAG TPA: hypothetical protein PKC28_13995 [Bdellovibrionales bacterium]|nr:hypothetical protein [Bdellovibrionales bacterium]
MILEFSAPSKTFLSGEYAVLNGGPALVLTTAPRFHLRAESGAGGVTGFHESSPAGRWLRQREPVWRGWKIAFHDPHKGRGGAGASGAQFLLAHAFTTRLQGGEFCLRDAWNDYQVLTHGQGSGADVLAQGTGGVSRVDLRGPETHAFDWPYVDMDFLIVRTDRKMPTHEHLQTLDRSKLEDLVAPARDVTASFGHRPAKVFAQAVKSYGLALRELELQAPATLDWLKQFESRDWCWAAKGSGAMGADMLTVLLPIEARVKARQMMNSLGLEIMASSADLSAGLKEGRNAG